MRSKLSILSLALLGYGFSASAAPITPAEALQRVKGSNMKKIAAAVAQQSKLAYTFETENGSPAVYVFNQGSQEGYMLLSADDAAVPVLGYADSGVFEAQNMPPQMKWWLSEYARQIAYASENNIQPVSSAEAQSDFKAIAPMVSSRWNQDAPYNLQCPTDPSTQKKCVTGCVATAMSQVMNYWKYPAVGTGTISYRPTGFSTYLSLNLANQKFDWANMLDRYVSGNYNSTQSAAVAYLMKACGYSVNMNYSSGASGAQSYDVGSALMKYFTYNKNISYEQRDYYTATEWNKMVYDELAAGRPVLYAGQSDGGGHEFVCDGYSEGFFHINWGWGGMSDGYFKLEALNPDSEGIGGGSGGFNYSQDILTGVQPTQGAVTNTNLLLQAGTMTATASGLKVTPKLSGTSSGVWNWGYNQISVGIGMEISPVDKPESKTYVPIMNGNVNTGRGYSSVSTFNFPSTLADGKYKCLLVNKNNAVSNSQWIPIRCKVGNANYVYVTKKGSALTVENVPVATLSIKSASAVGDIYYECVASLTADFTNTSDVELSELIVPVIWNSSNKVMLRGDAFPVSVMPGETETKTISTIFTLQSGVSAPTKETAGTLKFINKLTGAYYDLSVPVKIKVNPANATGQVQNFKILNTKQNTVNGVSLVWLVSDPENIPVSFKLRGATKDAYFGYPVYVYISPYGSNSILKMSYVPDSGVSYLEAKTLKPVISFAEAEPETLYTIGVLYHGSYNGSPAYIPLANATMVVRQSSGVEDAEMESDEPVEYFDLQGRKIENPSKGIYIKRQGAKVKKIIL